jgi:DNA-binding MarR family transcriptional regulator
MTDDRPRIEGKFYPLQNDEWLQACKELKPAELKLLYHLRTNTPFGDRSVELGVTEIALLLGMSKSTVSEGL